MPHNKSTYSVQVELSLKLSYLFILRPCDAMHFFFKHMKHFYGTYDFKDLYWSQLHHFLFSCCATSPIYLNLYMKRKKKCETPIKFFYLYIYFGFRTVKHKNMHFFCNILYDRLSKKNAYLSTYCASIWRLFVCFDAREMMNVF